jgi:uroporphyrinogen decarboxylase
MTGRERISAALGHREGDRVPYDLGGTTVTAITKNAFVRAMRIRGLKEEFGFDDIDPIQQIVIPDEEILDYLNVDTRRIGAQRISDYPQNRTVTGKVIEVRDFYGCRWQHDPEKDIYFNQVSFPLEKYDTLSEALQYLPGTDWNAYADSVSKNLDDQVGYIGEKCGIADRNTAGLTENSLRIRGYEKWYIDTLVDLPGVEALLDRIVDDKIRYWDIIIDWAIQTGNENRIQVVSECDDLGSQSSTILEVDKLRQVVIPRLKTIYAHLKKRLPNAKAFMHSCGAIREVIPDLIEAGVDILNPVQFTAAGMELKGLKKDFGDVLSFWGGGVDTQSVLNQGTPQQVIDQVKEILDIMAPGGGFVFAPVHNIQEDVPPENFWAMWDTLQAYGKY